MQCQQCGHSVELTKKPGRSDFCPRCDQPLHSCLNCTFYDDKAYHQCREPQSEWVSDKNTANFCDYFTPADRPFRKKQSDKADLARKKLDELFGM